MCSRRLRRCATWLFCPAASKPSWLSGMSSLARPDSAGSEDAVIHAALSVRQPIGDHRQRPVKDSQHTASFVGVGALFDPTGTPATAVC